MDAHWYVDALDARAGRAFVSFRPEILTTAKDLDAFEQSYFIAPPSFEPEAVSGASIGMTGTRATFQGGLYDEEGEVPFPSLATVVDFVRRAYLSGGGGAGPDGAGPPGPPEEGGPGGEGPFGLYQIEADFEGLEARSESGATSTRQAAELLNKLSKFGNVTGNTERGSPRPSGLSYSNFGTVGSGEYPVAASQRLVRAVSLLWLELLYRAPTTTADVKSWRRWWLSMSALEELFAYLRLHDLILVDRKFSWQVVDRAAEDTRGFLEQVSNRLQIPLSDYRWLSKYWVDVVRGDHLDPLQGALLHWLGPKSGYLFWQYGYKFLEFDNIEDVFHHYVHRRFYDEPIFAWSEARVRPLVPNAGVSILNALPFPISISKGIGFGSVGRRQATLFNFMSVCCATTDEVFASQPREVSQARFDLLFLAAFLIVSEPGSDRSGRNPIFSGGISSVLKEEIEYWHNTVAEKALKWLPSNLPQFAFAQSTEEMIGAARQMVV